jgi:glycosyltransferase involved in cell wall biosynthesis
MIAECICFRFLVFVPYCVFFKQYIRQCLESVHDQTHRSVSVIVVDDGNDDPELIAALQSQFQFTLLVHKTRLGPAASKWTFLEHVQCGIKNSVYTRNDIVIILDGDDYLNTTRALTTIHNTYTNTKCMATIGEATGKYCQESRNKWRAHPRVRFDVRAVWMYNHPRTFRAVLTSQFRRSHFQKDGTTTWLTKCTDRPIVYTMFDYFGAQQVQHIDTVLYHYRDHPQNTHRVVSYASKHAQLNAIAKRPRIRRCCEDIHIVMCCWKRVDHLTRQLWNLNNQTVSTRIVVHLVNNNPATRVRVRSIVTAHLKHPQNTLRVRVANRNNTHYGFERFFYIRDHLVDSAVNYVCIIDDDQLFARRWVEQLYSKRAPKKYITWYGRRWKDASPTSYWEGSLVTSTDCMHQQRTHVKRFHYGGTGGCIIDINIFGRESNLWKVPEPNKAFDVFNIEDLWLSFVVTHGYGWTIQRSFLPCTHTIGTKNALWKTLKRQKTHMLHYLIHVCRWTLK